MCLKFPEFEAGCAYELYAYKKKRVLMRWQWQKPRYGFNQSLEIRYNGV